MTQPPSARGPGIRKPGSANAADDEIATDHSLHWLGLIGIAGYAWQLHGFFVAVAGLLALLLVIAISNLAILATSGRFALVRVNRWAWLVVALVLLALSGASGGRV